MATTNWNNLVSEKALQQEMRKRKNAYIETKDYIYDAVREQREQDGYELVQEYADKKYAKYRKEKLYYDAFEDKVWCMLAQMGFTEMNAGKNQFKIAYAPENPNLTQQIDVFAADEETVLIVECKSSETLSKAQFKKEIEALKGQISGIIKEVRKKYPAHKIKFIWATQNILIGDKDAERLAEAHVALWDDDVINYYQDLCRHLGTSAKFQLLGNLFENQSIEGLKVEIPAVRGSMGGHTYYAFSIEPATLLKLGYVLHRTKGNVAEMPTYQRIIKKNRLMQVREFVDNGGYFPNSILISIDSGKKDFWFDPLGKGNTETIARAGILHLPPRYHSAFIIDGQHRLYGYSDSKYAESNTIPVVAFENLSRTEQLKLFMEINENQKAVSKDLRSTLEKDTLWVSKSYNDRRRAMRSKIAQRLGEHKESPLYGRVLIGEDTETTIRNISISNISDALNRSNFLNSYTKSNALVTSGSFDFGETDESMEASCDRIVKVLEKCFAYLEENCASDWASGKDGVLAINRGIYGAIRLVDDIVSMLKSRGDIDTLADDVQKICTNIHYYLEPLTEYINSLTLEDRQSLKNSFGTNGSTKFWRYFEQAVSKKYDEFKPEGLQEYIEDQTQKYNNISRGYLEEIERDLRSLVRGTLEEQFGVKDMIKEGMPKDVYKDASKIAAERNAEIETSGEDISHVSPWDCITLDKLQDVITYRSNWSNFFSDILKVPGYDKGNQTVRTQWIKELYDEKRKLTSTNTHHSVKKEMFDRIETIHRWLKEHGVK